MYCHFFIVFRLPADLGKMWNMWPFDHGNGNKIREKLMFLILNFLMHKNSIRNSFALFTDSASHGQNVSPWMFPLLCL